MCVFVCGLGFADKDASKRHTKAKSARSSSNETSQPAVADSPAKPTPPRVLRMTAQRRARLSKK